MFLFAKSKIRNRENREGKQVETPEVTVKTLGESYGNIMGNGGKWLETWGNITLRESP